MLEAFGQWMAAGFEQVAARRARQTSGVNQLRSWRFWAAADGKHELVCGLGRDSHDSLGRPYPLLLLGQGCLDSWWKQWHLLPRALEETWRRLEYIAATGHGSLADFWQALAAMEQPGTLEPGARDKADFWGPDLELRLQKHLRRLGAHGRTAIRMKEAEAADPVAAARNWHRLLSEKIRAVPRAVFMGGTLESTFMVISLGPLAVEDFVDLWTGPSQAE